MKKLYFFLASLTFLVSGTLTAQTYYFVDVANFAFTPQQLQINVGDTVLWTNSQGQHSVEGNAIDFPDNPESFGNQIGDAGWNYEFIFNLPGVYSYKCGVHSSMTGSVTVSEGTVGIAEVEKTNYFAIFPNPVVNQLSWKWDANKPLSNANMTIYDTQGKKVDQFSVNGILSHDVSAYNEGIYTFVLMLDNERIQSGKFLINR